MRGDSLKKARNSVEFMDRELPDVRKLAITFVIIRTQVVPRVVREVPVQALNGQESHIG